MNGIDNLAAQLQKTISEKDKNKKVGYDTRAEVVKVDDDVIWVKIPGGTDETPVSKTVSAKEGDNIQVRVAGGRAWAVGNYTAPATDDTVAIAANTRAGAAQDTADTAIRDANIAQLAAEVANQKADEAVRDAELAHAAADSAAESAGLAKKSADEAQVAANGAQASADAAQSSADAASQEAATAKSMATSATTSANNALTQLATVESVIDTVNWLSEHAALTEDTSVQPNKNYYIRNESGTYVKVTDPTGNPSEQGWYEMDEAISNYVAAHMSLTDYGLNLVLDNSSYRVHIGTYTATGDDGVYIIDESGNVVSFFGESIKFGSDRPQYIGNNNAFILFDPSGQGSLTIGGATIRMGSQTLDQVLAEKANSSDIPTNVSELNNDSGFLTDVDVSVTQTSTGADITIAGDTVSLTNGAKGEDATVLRVDSSRGNVFKNNMVSTVLTVHIYRGGKHITNITDLRTEFGSAAYLQWYWQKVDETSFHVISTSDSMLSNDGFTLTLTPDKVDTKVTFQCELIV